MGGLDFLHLKNGGHEDEGGDDLVEVEGGVEEAPGDGDGGEGLHHFEVAGGGSFR